MRFVVHEHGARHRHYDFRVELGGTLKSWAVPKGPSMDSAVKRLAVQVEDHPLSYARFEGVIPAGQYGAGPVVIWDAGAVVFESEAPERDLERGKLSMTLRGKKLRGGFTLIRMKKTRNQWLLIKQVDTEAVPGFETESELTASRLREMHVTKDSPER